ncbi:DMT family transporter [uncultured Planktomarina sp.]|uniref:DMT family transporter n=1 Tax=uncultured Planktomarina sp. TaxID=1538529 RepID=UPI000E9CAF98|nr:EamA family transporter [Planktomarina temperata]
MQRLWLAITPLLFLILWSAGYVVAKVALVDAAPMALLALRFAAVIAIMAVLFAVLRPPLPKTLSGYLHLGFVGVLMQTVYFGMAYFSFVNGVAAGTAALIFSLQPILVALLAPRWTGEAVSWLQWFGLAIAMIGTLTVIVARLEIGPPPLAGFGFAALALAGITLATLWEKRFGLSHHPVSANLIGYSAGLLGLLPFLNWAEIAAVNWTPSFYWALAYLVIGNSVVAVGLLLAMIRAGQVSRVSTLLFLVPPLAALIAWLTLDEPMPLLAWVGLLVSGGGVYLATRPSKGSA